MNRLISIELFERHSLVNFYTVKFEGEISETEKFFAKYPEDCKYDEDIDIIISWIDRIGDRGSLKRYFRPEGKYGDNLQAIPGETSKLRLFCLRISDNIVILGNGGVKSTRTYNEDPLLNCYATMLQKIDEYIKHRMDKEKLYLYSKDLYGNLNFRIDIYCNDEE